MDMLFRLPVLAAVVSLLSLPAVAGAAVSHLVVPGETLSGIAAANGLSPAHLAGANGLSADAFVIAGRSLTIPPRGTATVASGTATATPAPFGGYRVRLGDSLSAIAAEHGVSLTQLAAVNGLSATGTLVAGTSLRLPGAATATQSAGNAPTGTATIRSAGGGHAVVPGETLTGIAAANGVTPAALAAANGLAPNAFVIAGTHLKIPAAGASATATPAANVPSAGAATGSPGRLTAGQIGSIAAANGAPASLASAIAWQESGFNNAMVSAANARGVMQVMPGTWAWVQANLARRQLDPALPIDNVGAGVLYLGQMLRDFGGDPALAAAGYYQGGASVRQIGMLPETRQYVADVLALRSRFGGP
jgi:LysM repeat protein